MTRCPDCGASFDPEAYTGGFHCPPPPRMVLIREDELAVLRTEKSARQIAEARVAALEEENDALRRAMPDPSWLRILANWFDADDEKKGRAGQNEVQDDLRRWADAIESALSAAKPEKPHA